MAKKMFVIQAEDGMFFCGMRHWDKQLRKAKIYHSLAYAKDVVDAYEECNCKIVEVSLAIVPEAKTNADRIRAMSDEELAETMYGMVNLDERIHFCQNKAECNALLERNEEIPEQYCIGCLVEWLKQPAEEVAPNG